MFSSLVVLIATVTRELGFARGGDARVLFIAPRSLHAVPYYRGQHFELLVRHAGGLGRFEHVRYRFLVFNLFFLSNNRVCKCQSPSG